MKDILSGVEEEIFERFELKETVSLGKEEFYLLDKKGLLHKTFETESNIVATLSSTGMELKTSRRKATRNARINNTKWLISLFISMSALIISAFSSYQNHIQKNKEHIQITGVNDVGIVLVHHENFDRWEKAIEFIVVNNSQVDVSILGGAISFNNRTYELLPTQNNMPLNISPNSSRLYTYYSIDLSFEETLIVENLKTIETLKEEFRLEYGIEEANKIEEYLRTPYSFYVGNNSSAIAKLLSSIALCQNAIRDLTKEYSVQISLRSARDSIIEYA